MRFALTGYDWSMSRNYNTWDVFLDKLDTDEADFRSDDWEEVACDIRSLDNAREFAA